MQSTIFVSLDMQKQLEKQGRELVTFPSLSKIQTYYERLAILFIIQRSVGSSSLVGGSFVIFDEKYFFYGFIFLMFGFLMIVSSSFTYGVIKKMDREFINLNKKST